MDSRLYDYFVLNTEANEEEANEEEQDASISVEHLRIIKEQLVNFILNDDNEEYIEEYEKISELINTNSVIKDIYLYEKRKYDLERYLNNEMDFGERCEIEELFKINSRLSEHFELKKDVNVFLETALKDQLKNIHSELYDTDHNNEPGRIEDEDSTVKDTEPVIKLKPGILKIGKWVAAASIILMVSTLGMNYFTSNQNSLEERLYNSYYEPFQNNTKDFFNSTYLIEAKKKYNNKEYDIAWVLINNLPKSMTLETEKVFYTGLTLMELESYTEAINKFKLLQANKELIIINSIGQWYQALCYLKLEKRADAIDILEKIVADKNYNHSKAKKILKKLT